MSQSKPDNKKENNTTLFQYKDLPGQCRPKNSDTWDIARAQYIPNILLAQLPNDAFFWSACIEYRSKLSKIPLARLIVLLAQDHQAMEYVFSLSRYGISIMKIRRSWDCLIFIMGIPIQIRWHLYIEMTPVLLISQSLRNIFFKDVMQDCCKIHFTWYPTARMNSTWCLLIAWDLFGSSGPFY